MAAKAQRQKPTAAGAATASAASVALSACGMYANVVVIIMIANASLLAVRAAAAETSRRYVHGVGGAVTATIQAACGGRLIVSVGNSKQRE